jgi:hypothetical protein
MSKTLEVVFDGEVLRPEEATGLEPNTRYRVTIEEAAPPAAGEEQKYPLTALLELATDMGVPDLAARHDHYSHGKSDDDDDPAE